MQKYTEIRKMFPYIDGKDVTLHIFPSKGILDLKPKEKAFQTIELEVNSIAADILCMFNGENSLEDIIKFFSDKYNDKLKNVYNKILKFIISLRSNGISIKFSSFPQTHHISIYGSRHYIMPLHVAIELTYRCNLKCRHCYVESDTSRKEIMPIEVAKYLLEELNKIGVTTIELTGGEPTIHPNFFEILKYSVNLNFKLIGVLTNGTLLDSMIMDYIVKHKDKIVIQIDLHGSSPEYVKWFTRSDFAFEKAKSAIEYLASKKVLVRVVANIGPLNINQMDEIASFSKKAGATAVGFTTIVPMGRAIKDKEKYNLVISDKKTFSKYIETFENLRKKYGSFIYTLQEHEANAVNCGAGTRSITISPKGFIKLCQMYPSILPLENISNHHLKDILEKSKDLFFSLENLPAPSVQVCGNCKNLGFCIKCITRGIMKAKENRKECIWYEKYIQGTVLEKLLD